MAELHANYGKGVDEGCPYSMDWMDSCYQETLLPGKVLFVLKFVILIKKYTKHFYERKHDILNHLPLRSKTFFF